MSGWKNWLSEPHVADMMTIGSHVGVLLELGHGLGAERAGRLDQHDVGVRSRPSS